MAARGIGKAQNRRIHLIHFGLRALCDFAIANGGIGIVTHKFVGLFHRQAAARPRTALSRMD